MAVTKQQIIDYLLANPNLSDAKLVSYMEQNGISPALMANAVGVPEGKIISSVASTVPQGQSVTLGDTRIAPQYQVIGSGIDQQIGGIENIVVEKTTGDVNYKAPVGSTYQTYSPTGEFTGTGKTQKVDTSLGGVIKDIASNPLLKAGLLAYGLGTGLEGLLGGAGAGAAGTTGLTMGELAQLDLALGGAGGTAGATSLANALATGATIPTLTNLTGGSGVLTGAAGGITADSVAAKLAADGGAGTGLLTGTKTAAELAADKAAADAAAKTTATTGLSSSIPTGVSDLATKVATNVGTGLLTNGVTNLLGNAVTGGLGLTGGLLQSQTSKEAAQKAASDITKATQTAQEAAQFRPVGMTTRFGTSNFTYDPITGQMVSAGYQLSPEAKAAQDRLVALAGRGLTQAEQAQQQFAPLQQGATNLFNLGNQYISQSPEQVAQDYINKQMALLQPSREMELANLQNRLQQQGRAGLSVAQGGTLGATTPELQALYNARAQQELQLAANAQQAGQQNTLFGAGLLGQGAQAMGNYYGGQAQAYQPYTTALGQVQGLETAAQQPLTMGANLAQQASTAGARSGQLGLQGTIGAGTIMTSPAVTNNPYASFLGGLASPQSLLGQGIANYITGYNPTADQNAVINPYFTPSSSVWGG